MIDNLPETTGLQDQTLPKELAELQTSPQEETQINYTISNQNDQENEIKEEVQEEQPKKLRSKLKVDEYKNIAMIRQKMEQAERERDEALRQLREKEHQSEEFNISPDDIVEGKHLSALHKEIRNLKEQLQNFGQQSAISSAEARLKSKYTDFDSVVNYETVEALKDQYPEIYKTIYHSKEDLYAKGVSAYSFIKKMSIVPESAYDNEKQKIHANNLKPKPMTSLNPQQGESPLSRANAFANGLTDELKEQLHKEMMQYRRSY